MEALKLITPQPADTTAPTILRPVDMSATSASMQWIIQSVVAKGLVSMIAGEPGCGKSLLAVQWAVLVAASRPKVRTLIVDAENGDGLIRGRLQSIAKHFGITEHLSNIIPFEARGLDLVTDLDAVGNAIATHRPDFVILDSLASIWSGNEQSVVDVRFVLEGLRTIAQTYNCAILIIHHTTKTTGTYAGSRAIAAIIEAVYVFARPKGGAQNDRVLRCVKLRPDREPAPLAMQMTEAGVLTGPSGDWRDTVSGVPPFIPSLLTDADHRAIAAYVLAYREAQANAAKPKSAPLVFLRTAFTKGGAA